MVHIINRPISDESTVLEMSTYKELLSDWSICLSVLHMIGQSKMKENYLT